jgi:hypothetical protein
MKTQEASMTVLQLATVAAVGILISVSGSASAKGSSDSSLGNPGFKAATTLELASKKNPAGRCRADFRRDRFGYCVPNWNA